MPSLNTKKLGIELKKLQSPSESTISMGFVKDPDLAEPNMDKEIVDWETPDDRLNPLNWSPRKKLSHVMLVSSFTLYS
ncbi:fluconazole resistance protein 1 [Colletotrichum higginsianum]|nr:fluconazole resistance protein 1 [Colletotrichum higginsianum]